MDTIPSYCRTGFKWNGTPVGQEVKLAGVSSYVTGSNTNSAVMIIHDIFGWQFPNNRLLADHFAAECDSTKPAFDMAGFWGRNNKEIRGPEMLACAKALKSTHSFAKVAVVGYCYGGWGSFQLGSKENAGVIDCVAVAHPSRLENKEIDNLAVPTLIIAPEHDKSFTPELKAYANEVLKKNFRYRYDYFPGLSHGFAARADQNDKVHKEGLEAAKRSVVSWSNEFLH